MPLADRERFASSAESNLSVLERTRATLGAKECAILRTCNRVEIYSVTAAGHCPKEAVRALFSEACEAPDLSLADSVYHYSGEDATTHLFRVASGLDSMILGEHEVLGQVKSALNEALESGHAGPILTRLFNHAIRVGKRARRETAISSGIFSVGQCAARLAQEVLGELRAKRLLVFGAGRIAKVTAKHMAALGAGPITVFSRTRERAQCLAAMLEAEAVTAENLPEVLQTSDILVGCASAPHHVVKAAEIHEATKNRDGRPLVVIDLGVPRNVDPEVGKLPGVRLFNLDDLEYVVAENIEAREAEIQRVNAIVAEEAADFQSREAQAEAALVIAKLRAKVEQIRLECLARADRKQLSDEDLAFVDYLTDLLVRKLLHKATVALREHPCGEQADDVDLAAAVTRLFDLDSANGSENPGDCAEEQSAVSLALNKVSGG